MSSCYRHFLLICCMLLGFSAGAQVTANFTANPTEGCPPLVVTFTNTSTNATSYSWDLGNSTITSQTNPQTSYLNPGTYTVTLTASGPNGTTSVKTMTITVHPLPTVNFTGTPLAVCPGSSVQFTDQSNLNIPGSGTYLWDFGDGGGSTSQNPSHIYYNSGFFNVSLFATNSQGCQSNIVKNAYVQVYSPPAMNISAVTPINCHAPAVVTFNNTTTGTSPITFDWDFGDGNQGTGTTPTHTYANVGNYTVTVIATDGNGCKDTLTLTNHVVVTEISANFVAPDSVCIFTPVAFTNTSSTHQSRTWFFGDLTTSIAANPTHTYSTSGTMNVMLVIVNGACSDTIIHQVVVLPQPAVNFTINPGIACPPPSTLQLTSTAPPGTTYQWDFGTGTSTLANPTVTYSTTGVKTITLVATTPFGCKDTIVKTDTIYNSILTIDATPDSGCAPLNVGFTVAHITTVPFNSPAPYPSPIVSYLWNFGDLTPNGVGPTVNHTYINPGIYFATVTVQTANGCTFIDTIEIRAGIVPVAGFTMQPTHVCYNDSVKFVSTSTNATGYLWIYGDGGLANGGDSTIYFYQFPGIFTPILVAYNNGCPDTFFNTIQVTVDSPMAVIDYTYMCNPRTQVQFENQSLGATTWLWDFGDGTFSTANNPLHNFPSLGNYIVKLSTWNATTGCRDTADIAINLVDMVPNFTANDTAICPGDTVYFTSSVSGGTPTFYYWYVNGILEPNNLSQNAHAFWTPGLYTIMLVMRDINGCYDTITKTNNILVAKPNAAFTSTPPNGCAALNVLFTDNSTDQPGTFFTTWEWTFGNGTSTVTSPNVNNVYINGGNYNVSVILTDNVGCKDTATGTISAFQPSVSFVASTIHPCVDDSVTFTNFSTGSGLAYEWQFGDGGTSTLTSPKHAYATGTYTVTLIATDANGCKDTFIAANYIIAASPVASFTLDSIAVCPPLQPNIVNTSTSSFFYQWDLGNGNTSTLPNPSVTYVSSGAFDIILIASNQYGCKDTAYHTATIYGFGGAFNYTPLEGCAPHTVLFQANLSNVPSITWDFNDGTVATTSATDTISHTYWTAGFYLPKLILSDGTGCQTSNLGLDTIKVDSLIMGFYANSPCINSTATFVDTSHGLFSSTTITAWWWQFHDGTTSSAQNPTFPYGPSGNYPVTLAVTSSTGCIDTLEGQITIRELPIIDACPDTTVCVGDPATLYAYGGVSYVWTPDDGTLSCSACLTPQATTPVEATYNVEGTDVYGCKNTDTVRVFLKTKTESIATDTALCLHDTVMLSVTQAAVWNWTPTTGLSDPTIGNPLASPDTTTTYTIITKEGSCIPDTVDLTVVVHPLPVVALGEDVTITGGGTAHLQATGTNIFKLAWVPANTLSCDSCDNPDATPKSTTNYTVYAFTDYGCLDTADQTVFVVCDNSQLFIPTVFTPNNDGENDKFYPRGKGVSLVKSIRIYNRWGEMVYERKGFQLNDEAAAWDGRFKGDDPRGDVYVYIMDALCDTGEPMTIKGDVTIIR
jgi:gliding motility-associated-like protein